MVEKTGGNAGHPQVQLVEALFGAVIGCLTAINDKTITSRGLAVAEGRARVAMAAVRTSKALFDALDGGRRGKERDDDAEQLQERIVALRNDIQQRITALVMASAEEAADDEDDED